MIEPLTATCIMIGLAIFLLILIPLLDSHEKLGKYISLRYVLATVCLILGVGCVLDFSHLAESSRNIVLWGAFGIVALFVIVRSFEKVKLGSRKFHAEVHKGDAGASVDLEPKPTEDIK